MYKWFIVLFCCSCCLTASLSGEYETVVVELNEVHPTLPVYLAKPTKTTSTLSQEYLESLYRILFFDLHHNGQMHVLPSHVTLERFASPKEWQKPSAQDEWEREDIYYVLAPVVEASSFYLKWYSVVQRQAKVLGPVTLTGDLDVDRRSIHQLADQFYQALFATPGIATTKILYTNKTKEGSSLIEADYDGENRRVLHQQKELIVTPQYVPAPKGKMSSHCVFVSYVSGEPKLYLSPLSHYQPVRMTTLKGNQLTPALSCDCGALAFVSDVRGNPDLYYCELSKEGGFLEVPRCIFGYPKATQASPSFHPEGKKLAFVSNKDGATRIYQMPIPAPHEKIAQMKPELVTKRTRESSAPNYSPDGKMIAYCSKGSDKIRQIWVYDCQTHEEKQITHGPFDKENPAWAPNSRHLVYNAREQEGSKLYLVHVEQRKPVMISQGPGENRFPSWSKGLEK